MFCSVRQRWLAGGAIVTGLAVLLLVIGDGYFFGWGLDRLGQRAGEGPKGEEILATDSALRSALAINRARFDRRFDRWLAAFNSTVEDPAPRWNPGATSDEMRTFEKWAGRVPADLRRLLLIHDGQHVDGTPVYWVDRLLSSREIMIESDENQKLNSDFASAGEKAGTIPVEEAGWWHPNLMLFLSDDNGGGVAIDRETGAVWSWDHDGGIFSELAPDLGTFFERMAIAFEEGRFTIEDAGDLRWLPEINPTE